jgi:hypothetical protein
MISDECGMETAVKSTNCFSIKRLVRDYGSGSCDSSLGKLSVAFNISFEDVFARLTDPHTYRLDMVKSNFQKRDDFHTVKLWLSAVISRYEVIPAIYVFPNNSNSKS